MLRRPIRSDRLDLVPMTPAFLSASLAANRSRAAQLLGATLPADWPGDATDVLSMRLGELEADPALQPWLLRAMVLRSTGEMVGHIGFHTAPGPDYLEPYSPGGVEFGFTVFAPYRRRGYAREAAVALMQWARQIRAVQSFVMSIRPDNLPSQALAAQLGFVRIGSHIDEVDGPEDVLELQLPPHK